jgi:hypothetical protein
MACLLSVFVKRITHCKKNVKYKLNYVGKYTEEEQSKQRRGKEHRRGTNKLQIETAKGTKEIIKRKERKDENKNKVIMIRKRIKHKNSVALFVVHSPIQTENYGGQLFMTLRLL